MEKKNKIVSSTPKRFVKPNPILQNNSLSSIEVHKITNSQPSIAEEMTASMHTGRYLKNSPGYELSSEIITCGTSSDDSSIGTDNISELLSCNVIPSTPAKEIEGQLKDDLPKINKLIRELSVDNLDSGFEYTDSDLASQILTVTKEQTQEDVDESPDLQWLQQELYISESAEKNLLKAIHLDSLTKKERFSLARIEAEKFLLSSTLRSSLIRQEIESVKWSASRSNLSAIYQLGSVAISNIVFYYEKPKNYQQYIICVVNHGCSIFTSEILEVHGGIVVFPNTFRFSNLPSGFKISIRIYCLTVPKMTVLQRITCMSRTKCEVDIKTMEAPKRESLFTLLDEAEISIFHLRNQKMCRNIPLKDCDDRLFSARIVGEAKMNFKLSGFVDIAQLLNNKLPIWNKQWCCLKGTQLVYWNYAIAADMGTKPINSIDLENCVAVQIAKSYECARSRTLVLQIQKESEVSKYLLSADTQVEFEDWKRYLEAVVSTVQAWR